MHLLAKESGRELSTSPLDILYIMPWCKFYLSYIQIIYIYIRVTVADILSHDTLLGHSYTPWNPEKRRESTRSVPQRGHMRHSLPC